MIFCGGERSGSGTYLSYAQGTARNVATECRTFCGRRNRSRHCKVDRGLRDFIELAPNLAGLAELKSGIKVGDCACVYIKAIIPEKMKIKLIIVNCCDDGCVPLEAPYFITEGHIDRWVYSTPDAPKYIVTDFSE